MTMSPQTARWLELATASSTRHARNALDYVSLTGPQEAWNQIDSPEAAWVDGNALGKSFGEAWSIIHRMRGTHPWIKTRPPISGLLLGFSWDQMIPIMEKLWHLVPKDEVHPRCSFEPGVGFTGRVKGLWLTSGPGAGSRLYVSTYKAGARRVAGGQYDFVNGDEPMEPSILGEIRPRLLRRRGMLRLTLTPVPDMPDVRPLRKLIRSGVMTKFNAGLTEAACWPKGYPFPWHYQSEIDDYARGLLEHEVRMRIWGDWRPVVVGRWIRDFSESRHIADVALSELRGWKLIVWTDHGTAAGKQTMMLVAVRDGDTDYPQVVFLDEHVQDATTTPEEDAEAMLAMLRRNGLDYDHVDVWGGDVATSTRSGDIQKSNAKIRRALAAQLRRPLVRTKPFREPVKGRGSLSTGSRFLNTLFRRGAARVRPRCRRFVEALNTFAGDPWDPVKDIYDAGRYAVEGAVTRSALTLLHARY